MADPKPDKPDTPAPRQKTKRRTRWPKWSKPAVGRTLAQRILAAMEPGEEYVRSEIRDRVPELGINSAKLMTRKMVAKGLLAERRIEPGLHAEQVQPYNRRGFVRRQPRPQIYLRLTEKGLEARRLALMLG